MAAMSAPRASTAGAAGFAGCGGGAGRGSSGPGAASQGRGERRPAIGRAPVAAGPSRRPAEPRRRERGVARRALGRRRLDRAVIQRGGHPQRADRRRPIARSFEGVGFALAPARVPDIGRRRLGYTDLRGRCTGCDHRLSRRTGEIVNQRSQLRVGRIEHESRADGVECLLWSSRRQLTTRGGAKGHELLLVGARPLDAARGRPLGSANGLRSLWWRRRRRRLDRRPRRFNRDRGSCPLPVEKGDRRQQHADRPH